jgi:hypothetical protein
MSVALRGHNGKVQVPREGWHQQQNKDTVMRAASELLLSETFKEVRKGAHEKLYRNFYTV